MSYSSEELRIAEARTKQVIGLSQSICDDVGYRSDKMKEIVLMIVSEQISSIDEKSILRQINIDRCSMRKQ